MELVNAYPIVMVRTEQGKALRKAYESHLIHHGFNEHRDMFIRTDGGGYIKYYLHGAKGLLDMRSIIVAMRGRNPENPSDRRGGQELEQRLEPNTQNICNTLTSVQKDNLVLEIYGVDRNKASNK